MTAMPVMERLCLDCPACGRPVHFLNSLVFGPAEAFGEGEAQVIVDASLVAQGMRLHVSRCGRSAAGTG